MKSFPVFLLALALALNAFAQTTNQVVFSFSHKAGADSMVLDQTEFTIWNGKKVKLIRAQFYISKLELKKDDGSWLVLPDFYILADAAQPAQQHQAGTFEVSHVEGVAFGLGVDPDHNHLDPTTYPANHPLAPQDPSMHWGWSAGYRFMAIEGKVDNNDDGVPETAFEFHNLGDLLYKKAEVTGTEDAENGVLHLRLEIDYVKLFQNMSMTGNLIQHGSAPINNTMMINAATQGFISMPTSSALQEVLDNSLKVSASPNPFSDETLIRYELPAADALTLVVTNSLGQSVRTFGGLTAAGSLRFEKGNLPRGIYQYAFYENGNLLARKQFVIGE